MNTGDLLTVMASVAAGAFGAIETLRVVETRPKAIKVENVDNHATCWLPKSGLKLRRPGVATYENDYMLAPWFRNSNLNRNQERALGFLE